MNVKFNMEDYQAYDEEPNSTIFDRGDVRAYAVIDNFFGTAPSQVSPPIITQVFLYIIANNRLNNNI